MSAFPSAKKTKLESGCASAKTGESCRGASLYADNLPVSNGNALLIIDPQNDFHQGGSLAVPTAHEDATRIKKLIVENLDKFANVYVTLDTHLRYHIAHSLFWVDAKGGHPPAWTAISKSDLEHGKWRTTDPAMQPWGMRYVEALEKGGRFQLMIWPNHCLIGSSGHNVTPLILEALGEWEVRNKRAVKYVIKGNNSKTEHYSAIQAEVVVPEDPETQTNTKLLEELARHEKVFICGQALSHCVNYTTRDIVNNWNQQELHKLVLLQDASSSVPGFTEAGTKFVEDMKVKGKSLNSTEECAKTQSHHRYHVKGLLYATVAMRYYDRLDQILNFGCCMVDEERFVAPEPEQYGKSDGGSGFYCTRTWREPYRLMFTVTRGEDIEVGG